MPLPHIRLPARVAVVLAVVSSLALAEPDNSRARQEPASFEPFRAESQLSSASVTVAGKALPYQAIAGTLVVHAKDWEDVPQDPGEKDAHPNSTAQTSMFYVAYFKKDGGAARPITFLYNGGPGSASFWLHMGAFGPRRVVTAVGQHTAAAPYTLINNDESLLDVTDLVFIDAPGTGFSRIAGRDKEKAFLGVDQDAYAFTEFISQFLSRYGRWNSPKYLFGESYGTPRSAIVVNQLESERSIDVNGVILLSQILNFDLSSDRAFRNPGVDLPYQTTLPTYAATAWYHHKLPANHPDLASLLSEVEHFAMGDYAQALAAGSELGATQRQAVAEQLHQYTGLPVDTILAADLRIDGGEFRQNLQAADQLTTGRIDTRFSGPDLDPLNQRAEYDPLGAAVGSAYLSAFNEYARKELHYGEGQTFKSSIATLAAWDWRHQVPGQPQAGPAYQGTNVMPDLAHAMTLNPNLKVQLNAGYFDLATPFFQGIYEMHHLPVSERLRKNIEYHLYESGHMVYESEDSLRQLHDNVADFIRRTSGGGK